MSFIDTIINIIKSLFAGNKSASQTNNVSTNPNNVEGTNMRKSVFNVMVAGEKDASQIEYVKKQMQAKDAIGNYPYTISSDAWMYTINRAVDKYGNDHTDEYGTQYTAVQKHK